MPKRGLTSGSTPVSVARSAVPLPLRLILRLDQSTTDQSQAISIQRLMATRLVRSRPLHARHIWAIPRLRELKFISYGFFVLVSLGRLNFEDPHIQPASNNPRLAIKPTRRRPNGQSEIYRTSPLRRIGSVLLLTAGTLTSTGRSSLYKDLLLEILQIVVARFVSGTVVR